MNFTEFGQKLKTMSISNSTNGGKDPLTSSTELSPVPSVSSNKSSEVSAVLDEILTYTDPKPAKVKKGKSTRGMPKHLSGK